MGAGGQACYIRCMVSAAALFDLGRRYAELGLPTAARAALERARDLDPDSPAIAKQLSELYLGDGDVEAARHAARRIADVTRDAESRVSLCRAELAAGELSAARRAAASALELAAAPRARLSAHAAHAEVAAAATDHTGARAHALAGLEAFCELVRVGSDSDVEGALPFAEDLAGRAAELGAADDVCDLIAERAPDSAAGKLAVAAALSARQARGEELTDAALEAPLRDAELGWPSSPAPALRLAERKLRRRARDPEARADAERLLESAADKLAHTPGRERARVWLSIARARAEDPARAPLAEEAYVRGLWEFPGAAAARVELAELLLARGDVAGAARELALALRTDSRHALAWRVAVCLVVGDSGGGDDGGALVAELLEAANPGTGAPAAPSATHLAEATAEVARAEVLTGVHARGHRLKNQLGVLGARARSARKMAKSDELGSRLDALAQEASAAYDEWAAYLRSTRAAGPAIAPVSVSSLVAEVASGAPGDVEVSLAPSLPDVRGDRLLLEEAIRNLVVNALEACEGGGRVTLAARTRPVGGAPVVEIEVRDTGTGIAGTDLPRVLSPGFTTKPEGSGIGLAVAERAVAAHHGRLSIHSELGGGTRVVIVLPCDVSELAAHRTLLRPLWGGAR